jgi:hypothetical protein
MLAAGRAVVIGQAPAAAIDRVPVADSALRPVPLAAGAIRRSRAEVGETRFRKAPAVIRASAAVVVPVLPPAVGVVVASTAVVVAEVAVAVAAAGVDPISFSNMISRC